MSNTETKKVPMDFAGLVESVRDRGRKPGEKPVSLDALCERCDIARQQLYHLMKGNQGARRWVVERLAKGLQVDAETIAAAIAESRARRQLLGGKPARKPATPAAKPARRSKRKGS